MGERRRENKENLLKGNKKIPSLDLTLHLRIEMFENNWNICLRMGLMMRPLPMKKKSHCYKGSLTESTADNRSKDKSYVSKFLKRFLSVL